MRGCWRHGRGAATLALAGWLLGAAVAVAGEAELLEGPSFWDIGMARFYAPESPFPMTVGTQGRYWLWPFSFEKTTSLDVYTRWVENKLIPYLENQNRKDDIAHFRDQLAMLKKEEQSPKRLSPEIVLITDDDETLRDASLDAARNLLERARNIRFYTTGELGGAKLDDLNDRVVRDAVPLRRVVDAVAVFPPLPERAVSFEIRVYGLGRRLFPSVDPTRRLYLDPLSVANPATPGGIDFYQPALKRYLAFKYRREGSTTAGPRLVLKDAYTGWSWQWHPWLFVQSARPVTITRANGAVRDYAYLPFLIANNTGSEQAFAVTAAGLRPSFAWQGETLEAHFTDRGEADDFWKTQVWREALSRIQSGADGAWVREHDAAEAKDANDLAAKLDILPSSPRRRLLEDPCRLASQERARGLAIIRLAADNVEDLLTHMNVRLRLRRSLGEVKEDAAELYKEYLALAPVPSADQLADSPRRRLAGPGLSDASLNRLILRRAGADAVARFGKAGEPTIEDMRLYNNHAFAPLLVEDVLDWAKLAAVLAPDGKGVAARLGQALTAVPVADMKGEMTPAQKNAYVDAMNQALRRPALFEPDEYKDGDWPVEAKDLIDRGLNHERTRLESLEPREAAKLNRLILDTAAGPDVLRPCVDLAAFGRLVNLLALEAAKARMADPGVQDVFFEAKIYELSKEGAIMAAVRERAAFPASPRRAIPPAFKPYAPPDLGEVYESLDMAP